MNFQDKKDEIFRLILQKFENETFIPNEAYIVYLGEDYEVLSGEVPYYDFVNVFWLFFPECEKVEYFDPFTKEYKRIL